MSLAYSFLELPDDIIEEILKHISDELKCLLSFSCVCRRLLYSARKYIFHTVRLRPEKGSSKPNCRTLLTLTESKLSTKFQFVVKKVEIMYDESRVQPLSAVQSVYTDDDLARAILLFVNVVELILPVEILDLFQMRRTLPIRSSIVFLFQRPSLQRVTLSGRRPPSSTLLSALIAYCTNLHKLSFEGVSLGFEEQTHTVIPDGRGNSITRLKIKSRSAVSLRMNWHQLHAEAFKTAVYMRDSTLDSMISAIFSMETRFARHQDIDRHKTLMVSPTFETFLQNITVECIVTG
ncbi:hypothetical protein VKT23_006121 [Stygiomarasmius scandens]|uniref:F-box domain-containing protein n=1 Tax=Marasmiellus scandens TaxID=2682957 RepID=A0ABR1JTS3_9AGAR